MFRPEYMVEFGFHALWHLQGVFKVLCLGSDGSCRGGCGWPSRLDASIVSMNHQKSGIGLRSDLVAFMSIKSACFLAYVVCEHIISMVGRRYVSI